MKITVINNSANVVPCPDYVNCAPGTTKVMTGRSVDEYAAIVDSHSTTNVLIIGELEEVDRAPVFCDLKSPGNPPADQDYQTGVGFDIETDAGAAANVAPNMYFGVFDNAACTTPSVHATLLTATTGTIVSGSGTNLLVVTPSAAGILSCRVNDATDETVYFRAWPVDYKRPLNCSEVVSVTFTST